MLALITIVLCVVFALGTVAGVMLFVLRVLNRRTDKSTDIEAFGEKGLGTRTVQKPLPKLPPPAQLSRPTDRLSCSTPFPIRLESPFKSPSLIRLQARHGHLSPPPIRQVHPAFRRVRFAQSTAPGPSVADHYDTSFARPGFGVDKSDQEYRDVAIGLSQGPESDSVSRLPSTEYTSARSSPYIAYPDFGDRRQHNVGDENPLMSPISEERQGECRFCDSASLILVSDQPRPLLCGDSEGGRI